MADPGVNEAPARTHGPLAIDVVLTGPSPIAGIPYALPLRLSNEGDTDLTAIHVDPALNNDLVEAGREVHVEVLEPGNSVIAHLDLKTRRDLTYLVTKHPVHMNVTYKAGGGTVRTVLETVIEPIPRFKSILAWTILGAVVGLLAPHFPTFGPFFEWTDDIAELFEPQDTAFPFAWGSYIVQPFVEATLRMLFTFAIAGILAFLLFSGDRRASRLGLTVSDLRGGLLVGFLTGLNGPQVLELIRGAAVPTG